MDMNNFWPRIAYGLMLIAMWEGTFYILRHFFPGF